MAFDPDELSRRARDTADAHRRVAEALRANAESARRVAQAFAELAEVERREADADPDPHTAETRRYLAGLSDAHSDTVESEIGTVTREAESELSHAETADARAVAAKGGNVFKG